MAGILDFIDQKLGTRLGLLFSNPSGAMQQMNQQAGAFNQASMLATQAERNAMRGLPITPEQASAKQYVDKISEDLAMGFAGNIKPVGKTPYELAQEVAQKNAVEMLGLPANNTAMDRAKAMGFNIPTYHGTTQNFRIPERDVFVSESPSIANRYALKNTEENSLVIPMLTKSNTPKFEHLNSISYRLLPENVKSRFAAFDPARANEPDLLAAGIPLGLLAGTNVEIPKKEKRK